MSERHINDACKIHVDSIQDSFLPILGQDFLKILYTGIIDYDLGFGLVYIKDNKVVGFVLVNENTNNLFKEIVKRKWFMLSLSVMRKVLTNPSILIKIYKTFFYPKETCTEDFNTELLVLAVCKNYREMGIGKKLINSLNKRLSTKNIDKYKVSVYNDNEGANKFYKSVGFRLAYSFSLYDKKCNVYRYDIM